jgi:hypothetical protein
VHGTGAKGRSVGHPLAPSSRKGRASRRKGLDAERVLVRFLQQRGLAGAMMSDKMTTEPSYGDAK